MIPVYLAAVIATYETLAFVAFVADGVVRMILTTVITWIYKE